MKGLNPPPLTPASESLRPKKKTANLGRLDRTRRRLRRRTEVITTKVSFFEYVYFCGFVDEEFRQGVLVHSYYGWDNRKGKRAESMACIH